MTRGHVKPTKSCKTMIWFDVKAGKWYGDLDVMKEAVKNGMNSKGASSGASLVRDLYKLAKDRK